MVQNIEESYCDKILREMHAYQERTKAESNQKAAEAEEQKQRMQAIIQEADATGERFDKFKVRLGVFVDKAAIQAAATVGRIPRMQID